MGVSPPRRQFIESGSVPGQHSLNIGRGAAPRAGFFLLQGGYGGGHTGRLLRRGGQPLAQVGGKAGIASPGAAGQRARGEGRGENLPLGQYCYPGRLGDSPIIGAGNYADNRYGAAACTGMGEMAIRGSTAHSIIFYIKMGHSLQEAGKRAMEDLNDLDGRFLSMMRIITLDKNGNHAGFSSGEGHTYIFQNSNMSSPDEVARTYVPIKSRWD